MNDRRFKLNRLVPLVVLLILIVLAAGAYVIVQDDEDENSTGRSGQSADDELTQVDLFVPFVPNVQFAPLYVAQERGYFADEGIELQIEYSFNEVDGRDRVALNDLQFAIMSGEQILIGRSAEQPIVYVMEWYHRIPVGIVAPAESDIEEAEDLAGKTVSITNREGTNYVSLLALLEAVGLQENDINIEEIGFTAPEVMCAQQVDAASVYIANEPLAIAECYDVRVIEVSDYTSLVSNGLITNEQTIRENPQLVQSMVRAILRGIQYAIENPDETFDISLEYIDPPLAEAQYETERQVLLNSIGLWRSEQPGATSREAWERSQEILLDIGLLDEALDNIENAYTNAFVPASHTLTDDFEPSDLTLFVSFVPNVQFAPMYVAAERGFFDAQGINISFEHGFSEVDGRDRLAVGDLQFAILSGEQVIIGRSAEQPIVYVMEWYHRLPVGVVVPADSEIEEPDDLTGETVAVPNREGANYTALVALLESVGLSEDDIELQEIGFTAPEVMCAEQVNAAAVYIANEPLSIEECFEVRVIEISDYTSLVSNGLVTNEQTIQDNPELVRSMVQAWLDGIAYTIEHPDEAFEISLEYVDPPMPEEQYERQRQVLANSIALWRSDNPGRTTEDAWLATQDILLSLGLIDKALDDISAAYTNEFLPDKP